jgi:Predicted endonuclease containing a URI domain
MKQPCVYIITNYQRTVLYTGVTSDMVKRVYQHIEGSIDGFSKRYCCKYLIYYEIIELMEQAILREKQIKAYRREKKEALINAMNPDWKDLYESIL